MISLLWHVFHKGHSVEVSRGMTRAMADTSKGWLYRCECGRVEVR